MIFSGDCEDVISPDELGESAEMVWKSVPGVQTFRMTNRIRTNAELSVFIQNMMRLTRGKGRRMYPHVSAGYGNDEEEAEKLLKGYLALGYRYFEENAGSSEDVDGISAVWEPECKAAVSPAEPGKGGAGICGEKE